MLLPEFNVGVEGTFDEKPPDPPKGLGPMRLLLVGGAWTDRKLGESTGEVPRRVGSVPPVWMVIVLVNVLDSPLHSPFRMHPFVLVFGRRICWDPESGLVRLHAENG